MYKTKLESVSLSCKSHRYCSKTANVKIYPQILSTKASFYIYDRPLTNNVIASVCALNLQMKF